MAMIKSQLVLTDGMTGPLKNINKAMNLVLNSFQAVQEASGKSIDVAAMQTAREALAKANTEIEEMERNTKQAGNAADGLFSKFRRVAGVIGSIVSVKKAVDLSDTMAQAQARLSLLVDDESVDALQSKILSSAQSARASYISTMQAVSKLGMVAGDAFSDASGKLKTDELIKFSELLNKNFVVGGASAQEQASAMYQLTQAMGSGRLQGDEYRSIIENAPILAKSIEDYMRNVEGATGSMKDWASEGLLTADVIKAAVFRSADEIETRFAKMPMTWGQVWTMAVNKIVNAMQPLLSLINLLANHWDTLEPIVIGVATALGIMAAGWAATTAAEWLFAAATQAAITAMMSSPFTWFAVCIGLIIGLIYRWIQSVGGLANALDILKLGWKRAGTAIVNFVGDTKVRALTILQDMINDAIDMINGFIGVLNKIPGVEIDAVEHVTFATTAAAENDAAKRSRAEDLAAYQADLAAARKAREAEKAVTDYDIDAITASTGEIADHTGSVAESAKETTDDLKYLRDIAERDVINRFTTAEIRVDMANTFGDIRESADIDGVIDRLGSKIREEMAVAAEGVH